MHARIDIPLEKHLPQDGETVFNFGFGSQIWIKARCFPPWTLHSKTVNGYMEIQTIAFHPHGQRKKLKVPKSKHQLNWSH